MQVQPDTGMLAPFVPRALLARLARPIDVLAETVEGLLCDLESNDREIACRFLQGHTAEEVAVASGCSERTARRLRSRLKLRLRRLLAEGSQAP